MATEQFANNAQTTLSAAITSTIGTSLSVASASGFPSSAQYRIRVDNELMLVTAGAGTTTWTVTRGLEGTTAATHSNGATVTQVLTKRGAYNVVGGINNQTGTTYTISAMDARQLVTRSNSSLMQDTLPQATSADDTSFGDHFWFAYENRGPAPLILTPATSTIDGQSSLTLWPNQGLIIYSDGTNYWTLRGLSGRPQLQQALTLYVSTTGSDSNNGLTSGTAFATIQKAVNMASGLDNAGFNIIIQLTDGTYSESVTLKSYVGSGAITIVGNTTTPTNVTVAATSDAFLADAVLGKYTLQALKMTSTGGSGVEVRNYSNLHLNNVNFGSCPGYHMVAYGGSIVIDTNYAVSGGALCHWFSDALGLIVATGRTVTFSNAPNFTYTAFTQFCGQVRIDGMTFTNGNTVTGTRYVSQDNGVIFTGGGGANYIPGNAAGSTSNGGLYL
jgi:hypothetical protein